MILWKGLRDIASLISKGFWRRKTFFFVVVNREKIKHFHLIKKKSERALSKWGKNIIKNVDFCKLLFTFVECFKIKGKRSFI